MAQKLPKTELRKLSADFDPPPEPQKTHIAPTLKGGKRVRVTANLTQEQYELLKKLAEKTGQPMSRVLGMAVEALHDN